MPQVKYHHAVGKAIKHHPVAEKASCHTIQAHIFWRKSKHLHASAFKASLVVSLQ
ncbi:hypothetical protein COLO4_28432 [Corchorus olitorius]|uniref:Uncharacterized protein n=1 Tax=Corchorus olitorius TaxID=93759 RepID=A0A1R3HKX6_9ROSI|nr:hypothetical protein COLO4_28432 [Corchorus olitorius]